MKTAIHPDYTRCQRALHLRERVRHPFHAGDLHVEICSNCHPFYTGKQKLVDTGGRVERFQRKLARSGRNESNSPSAPPRSSDLNRAGVASRSRAGLPITQ